MNLRSLVFVPLLAASIAAVHCGGSTTGAAPLDGGAPDGGGVDAAATDASTNPNPDALGATTASKVDLLLVVDDSSSMGDKSKLLAASVGTLLRKVAAAGDVHVGVITSSLGAMGGDVCPDSGKTNTLAHLRTTGPGDVPVASAAKGFVAYGGGGASTIDAVVADVQALVSGVGEGGCGLEAQLESTYRFLVQPDPWQKVTINANNQAEYTGVDGVVLAQRKGFLRPDSLVVVVLLTDEDDSSADPRSIGGQGWAYEAQQFPGSVVFRPDGKSTTAPRATSACATNPASADCTSCGFAAACNPVDPACLKLKSDPECQKNSGYYGPSEDSLNVRFTRMKQRFGVDPQFPISRYVNGFTKQRAPNRDGEHTVTGTTYSAYLDNANCTNPLFAAQLPGSASEELCALPQGGRGKDLVVFAVIGGVPEVLATATPSWGPILGANPGAFDYTGIDPHMIASVEPRPFLPAPTNTRGDNGTDPIHGREWNTQSNDLQFACTFTLPTVRTCALSDPSCDCANPALNPPLCGPTSGDQVKAKAYPTVRELRVARDLGDRGIVGSICPTDAALGYASTMNTLAERLAPRIAKP